MKETTIYCPDIECDSCVKILNKRLEKRSDVSDVKVTSDRIIVQGEASTKDLLETVRTAGYRADTEPFARKTLSERWRHFKENKAQYKLERHAIKYLIISFLVLIALEFVAYLAFFRFTPNFLANYGVWILYLTISVASIGSAIWHFASYKTNVTCMMGMMIAMTVGMQTGMMIGAVLGATNGFFIGAFVGMILAVIVGAVAGKCCGIMGIMEGMMAGVMGGTMGAMITVMMFSDNINIFMPVYMLINVIITLGMIYLYFEESIEGNEKAKKRPVDLSTYLALCIIVTAVLTVIMLYGPKSAFLAF